LPVVAAPRLRTIPSAAPGFREAIKRKR